MTLNVEVDDLNGPMFVGEPENDVATSPEVAARVQRFLELAAEMVPLMWGDPLVVNAIQEAMRDVSAWKAARWGFGAGEEEMVAAMVATTDPQRLLVALCERAVATLPW